MQDVAVRSSAACPDIRHLSFECSTLRRWSSDGRNRVLHVLATDGVFTRDGRFHPVIWPEDAALWGRFRRRVLLLLERAGRLRPETRERFLARRHSASRSRRRPIRGRAGRYW